LIATEGDALETSGSLHDCQNAVHTSDHSNHTLCLNRIRLIRIRLIRIRHIHTHRIHIRIHHIPIHQGHHNHQDLHRRRINLRVGQIMQELAQGLAPALEELREQHLEGGVLLREDIDVYPPQNAFSQERTSLAAMRM
jgi:hypothetical protein